MGGNTSSTNSGNTSSKNMGNISSGNRGTITYNNQFSSQIAPGRMFHAFFLDGHNLMPKLLPQAIKGVEIESGDGGAGSVQKINFPEGGRYTYVKHRLDLLDKENFICHYTVIEGGVWGDKLESLSFEISFESAADGCVCKITSHLRTKAGAEISLEEIIATKEKAMGMYKVVETYLAENPFVYA